MGAWLASPSYAMWSARPRGVTCGEPIIRYMSRPCSMGLSVLYRTPGTEAYGGHTGEGCMGYGGLGGPVVGTCSC